MKDLLVMITFKYRIVFPGLEQEYIRNTQESFEISVSEDDDVTPQGLRTNKELLDCVDEFNGKLLEYFIDQVGSGESILLGNSVINSKKVLMIELKEWQIENVLNEDEE